MFFLRGIWRITKFVLILVLFVAGALGLWWWRIGSYTVQHGQLMIQDSIPIDRLRAVELKVDYLIDIPLENGHYSAIVPYSVQASFDLSQMEVNKEESSIVLPSPEIGDVLRGEPVVLRDEGSSSSYNIIEAFKQYGQRKAEKIARNADILKKAEEAGKSTIRNMLGLEREKWKIAVKQAARESSHDQERQEILLWQRFDATIDSAAWNGWLKKETPIYLFLKNKDSNVRVNLMRIAEATSLEGFLRDIKTNFVGTLFDPLNPSRSCKILFTNKRCYSFYLLVQGWIFRVAAWADDQDTFAKGLPHVLTMIDSLKIGKIPVSREIFGLSPSDWEKMDIALKKKYFKIFCMRAFSPIHYAYSKKLNWNLHWPEIYSTDSLKGWNGITLVLDKDAKNEFLNNRAEFLGRIKEAVSWFPGPSDEILGILYNSNTMHRDRVVIITPEDVCLYIPERVLQSRVCKSKSIASVGVFARSNKFTLDEGCNIWDDPEREEVIESPALCKFLKDLMKYGFPVLLR